MLMWWIVKNCDTFKHVIIHCSALRKHWLSKMKNEKLQINMFWFCWIISSFAIWKCPILKLGSDKCYQSLWCIILFQKVVWRYHFNLMPFYKVWNGDIIHKFSISFTDTSISIPEWYCFNSVQYLQISIWCHFKELGWYHSQISCTFSAAGAIIWYAATIRMKAKCTRKRPWAFPPLWTKGLSEKYRWESFAEHHSVKSSCRS